MSILIRHREAQDAVGVIAQRIEYSIPRSHGLNLSDGLNSRPYIGTVKAMGFQGSQRPVSRKR